MAGGDRFVMHDMLHIHLQLVQSAAFQHCVLWQDRWE